MIQKVLSCGAASGYSGESGRLDEAHREGRCYSITKTRATARHHTRNVL